MKKPLSILLLLGTLVLLLPRFASAQSIDLGKSYINVTKGLNGGTVEPGDTLEIRASVVVRSGTFDSIGYFDAVPAGTAYVAGTIRILTNEGKIYKQFTDAGGDDQGWIAGSNIRINFGFNGAAAPGTAFRRGRVINTHRPSFYGSTCIMIASFRVRVTAAYNFVLSIGGGNVTYMPSGGSLTSFVFPARRIAVYRNYGMCPNAVGSNALGTEFNGTFGTGKPRNRGTSANVPTGYTYAVFTSGGPNDYFYGISNNTSINTGYTTLNSWPKPDNTHRVFGVWDIIGDHTGATNAAIGNPATDTFTNNNGGYMLVINAAYRIDSAFQQTITNLCPNTYYEISLWMRNICSRCGCDSAGRGVSTAGYVPTAPGDSSGVYPNLSFNVNGVDYYSSGNVTYTGNWIKKGFTFLTGAAQTSFTLKVFNNAPGGGGNDWSLDDISVATCSPNLAFTPTNNPNVCKGNVVNIGAWIRSYFNNYTYYKWQRSINNGVTWVDDGPVGTGTPVNNAGEWEYFTPYPPFVANMADSGLKFRVVVASTLSNISSPGCAFADVASVLTLNVLDCGSPLATDILSFNGVLVDDKAILSWTTNREDEPIKYLIEKSFDGRNFSTVATVAGRESPQSELNTYQWNDRSALGLTAYYRIRMVSGQWQKMSRVVRLMPHAEAVSFINVPNPFTTRLTAELNALEGHVAYLELIDVSGKVIKRKQCVLIAGLNAVSFEETGSLPKGLYTLQVKTNAGLFAKKVLKQ